MRIVAAPTFQTVFFVPAKVSTRGAVALCLLLSACGNELAPVEPADDAPPESVSIAAQASMTTLQPERGGPEPQLDGAAAGQSEREQLVPESLPETDAPALAAAVTLDITADADPNAFWRGPHVRCDGIRIAANVVLTAAHCFAWHRIVDSEAPIVGSVRVRSLNANPTSEPQASALSGPAALALHVAIHPRYPALACSQPSRNDAALCLRLASRCWTTHGRHTRQRSACLQSVSEQVIEAQGHASYDIALVFVASTAHSADASGPLSALLAREAAFASSPGQVWLSRITAAANAWRLSEHPSAYVCLNPLRSTWSSFDLQAHHQANRRLFDGVFARSPNPNERPQLIGWASRALTEQVWPDDHTAVRYTRLAPHLLWLLDTIQSVARLYPELGAQMPSIAELAPTPAAPTF